MRNVVVVASFLSAEHGRMFLLQQEESLWGFLRDHVEDHEEYDSAAVRVTSRALFPLHVGHDVKVHRASGPDRRAGQSWPLWTWQGAIAKYTTRWYWVEFLRDPELLLPKLHWSLDLIPEAAAQSPSVTGLLAWYLRGAEDGGSLPPSWPKLLLSSGPVLSGLVESTFDRYDRAL